MAAKKKSVGFRVGDIHLRLGKVTAKTKLSQLTVAEYVELILQVNAQASAHRATPDAETIKASFEQVRKLIAEQTSASELTSVVRKTQQTIVEKIPAIFPTGPVGDGGPSKHPRAVAARAAK
jgi:hypothetical protein